MAKNQCRTDLLRAYSYFSPASVSVITRMEHMEQIPHVALYCQQLQEDGLLEHVPSQNSELVEYCLSAAGRDLLRDAPPLKISSTKLLVYHQLRAKEQAHAQMRHIVYQTLLHQNRFVCLLELHAVLAHDLTIPELSAILFGLLYTEQISICGPLYGIKAVNFPVQPREQSREQEVPDANTTS